MPTASYVKYTSGVEFLVEGINAGTNAWYVALANTVNIADTTFTSGTTDLATGNGYTAGGSPAATSTSTQTAGVYKLVLNSPTTWTATGSVGPLRYAILWNSTTSQPIAYWDYGSSITLTSGDTFAVTLDAANGVFTVGP